MSSKSFEETVHAISRQAKEGDNPPPHQPFDQEIRNLFRHNMPCSFYPANLLASATLPPRADLQSANNSTVTFRSLANAAGFTNPRFQILVGGCPPIGASNNCYFFGDSPPKGFATTLPATYYGALHQPKGVGTHPAFSPHGRNVCSERDRR